jgi:hypothetical protein
MKTFFFQLFPLSDSIREGELKGGELKNPYPSRNLKREND